VRGFVTGLGALSRAAMTQKVFAERGPAVEWLDARFRADGRAFDTPAFLEATARVVAALEAAT
jgi:hypothetical protein